MQREVTFARSVVALSALFLVTHVPFSITLVYQTVLAYTNTNPYSLEYTAVIFAYSLSMMLTSYNYVFPIVINSMFNRMFRDELGKMLKIKN